MVLAYLRGLLRPGYPMGIRSHLREELMLEAVARDLESINMQEIIRTMVQHRPGTPQKVIQTIKEMSFKLNRTRGFNTVKSKARNVDGLVAIYHALSKSKLADKLRYG
jgi:hypothetical protein